MPPWELALVLWRERVSWCRVKEGVRGKRVKGKRHKRPKALVERANTTVTRPKVYKAECKRYTNNKRQEVLTLEQWA